MELAPLARSIRAADIPMEKLAGNSQISAPEKLAEISRQFEAVLLRQILQQAHKTQLTSKVADHSSTGDIYQDMVTNQLADAISKSGAVGLAKSLQEQLAHELPSSATAKT